jgi:ATP phosphoribosyltransferase
MSDEQLILALPSKGRLMDKTIELFASIGMTIRKTGHERGYRGIVEEFEDVDVAFLSANEIAHDLRSGRVHLGVTGEDLVRENIADHFNRVTFIKALGFGQADVVVAVPESWLDVETVADLEDVAAQFQRIHGRRLQVATKYVNLTGRFFARNGFFGYRIVGSLGATEGAPASGSADLIVDITSTGETLRANHLKILKDGVILKSEANLLASRAAEWSGTTISIRNKIEQRLAG